MLVPEFQRMLDAALHNLAPTSVTLTEAPARTSLLTQLLEQALASGRARGARLTRIELPRGLFPEMGASFWQVPVADSGAAEVVRLYFEP